LPPLASHVARYTSGLHLLPACANYIQLDTPPTHSPMFFKTFEAFLQNILATIHMKRLCFQTPTPTITGLMAAHVSHHAPCHMFG
jgi:hypothetical protein